MFTFVEDLVQETDLLQNSNNFYPHFASHLSYNNLTNYSATDFGDGELCYQDSSLLNHVIEPKLTLNKISESVLKKTIAEQFLFYDLMLKKEDFDFLKKVKISDFGVMSYEFDGQNLAEQVENFLLYTITYQELIPEINNIILKLVNEILKISSLNVARISLVAQNKDSKPSFPCWHIDKTIAEENNLIDHHQEYVLIAVLKGATTLYQQIDNQTRFKFFQIANQTNHSYGYDINLHYQKDKGLDCLLNVQNSKSASHGQGSIHLSGKLKGTVHASPPEGGERLLLIVTAQEINKSYP